MTDTLIQRLREPDATTFERMKRSLKAADALEQQAAQIAEKDAEIAALRAACHNARDIIVTDRQSFVDCQRLRDTRTESPIEHGLVWVDEDTWVTPDDAEALHDYDRALALIDAALRQEQQAGEGEK